MIKVIIFDYDGVIVDSFPCVHAVYRRIWKKLGRICPDSFAEFRKLYAGHSRDMMVKFNFTEEEMKKANELYQIEILKEQPQFFQGIKEAIKELSKHFRLILVSSSPKQEVLSKLKKLNVLNYFEKVIAGEVPGSMKKIPALKGLLSELNLPLDEIIMIGDRLYDYDDAKAVGIKPLLVEYGWGYDESKIPNHKQKVLIHKPLDIIKAVEAIND